jgi:hypothetical protein
MGVLIDPRHVDPPFNYFSNRPRVGSDADRRDELRRWEDEHCCKEQWQRKEDHRREKERRLADQERLRVEER